tara:strand:+ start:499 stop:681 length:183 start_codon:yes stop_codon:yes gene_type:complete
LLEADQGLGEIFERYKILTGRRDGDPHAFVDPESWSAWLEILLLNAQSKLKNEREVAEIN